MAFFQYGKVGIVCYKVRRPANYCTGQHEIVIGVGGNDWSDINSPHGNPLCTDAQFSQEEICERIVNMLLVKLVHDLGQQIIGVKQVKSAPAPPIE